MPRSDEHLELLRRWAVLLDNVFRVPGTRIRFGVDALVGLFPGLGDLAAPVYTAFLLATGFRMRVPPIVLARMVLNALIDTVIGLVPVAGDLADVAWKANLRNMALLERYARPGVRPSRGDYVFVVGSLVLVALVALIPIALFVWLLTQVRMV